MLVYQLICILIPKTARICDNNAFPLLVGDDMGETSLSGVDTDRNGNVSYL
jgi:hypothetical protein